MTGRAKHLTPTICQGCGGHVNRVPWRSDVVGAKRRRRWEGAVRLVRIGRQVGSMHDHARCWQLLGAFGSIELGMRRETRRGSVADPSR